MNRLFKLMLIMCISILLSVHKIFSQSNSILDWEEIGEQIIEDDEEELKSWDNNFEDLEDLREHPLNLNIATRESLERFPFLTDSQIEHLLYYLYVAGPMETIYELQLVEDMDRQTIQYLLPFVYVGKIEKVPHYPTFKELVKYGKNEILTRLDISLNQKDGYRDYPDSVLFKNPNKRYMGPPFYHSLRYSYRYKDMLYWGVTAEKDAGEPFFAKKNKKGYDFYSFYLFLRNFGRFKTLAIGNYRVSFGQGLVVSTDYYLSKSSSITTIGSRQGGIRKHSSADESNYFRGVAASYKLGKFVLSSFYSHRKQDAIVENGFITSLKTDGMHRTELDFQKKNKVVNQVIGNNLTYSFQTFQLGITLVYNFFNKVLKPELKPYSVFYPQGRDFFNVGINYSYRWNKLLFFGETAVDKGGRVATLNTFSFAPLPGYQIVLLQRSYPNDYQALFARSVTENSAVRNEKGFYMGMEAKPVKYWKLFAYADFFRFPWLKYGVDKPSSGFDGLFQASFSPTQKILMFWRYQYKTKEKNYRDEKAGIKSVLDYTQHKFRYQLGSAFRDCFSLRTTIDFIRICSDGTLPSNGFMLFQSFTYTFQQVPLQIAVNYGYFDTDDFNTRLTIYEKGLLYAFSMPSFYGQGMRFTCNLRYDFNKQLTGLVKIAITKYNDRGQIGTSLERINGESKTDLYLQLKWKF